MIPPGSSPLALPSHSDQVVAALMPSTIAQGFSPEVARAGLQAEVASWSPAALATLSQHIDLALRPRVVLIIAARTLPASTLRQCVLARHLGARVLLKCAAGQEALAEALQALDPGITPRPFASGDHLSARAAIAEADTVVVLGSDETVAAVRAELSPHQGFAPHGHKVSAAWIGPDPSDATLAGLPPTCWPGTRRAAWHRKSSGPKATLSRSAGASRRSWRPSKRRFRSPTSRPIARPARASCRS